MQALILEDNRFDAMLLQRQLQHFFADIELNTIARLSDCSEDVTKEMDFIITDANLPDAKLPAILLRFEALHVSCPFVIMSGNIQAFKRQDFTLSPLAVIEKGEWPELKQVLTRLFHTT